ncbi:cell division protein FtsQ/DivIB [Chitinophaga sp. 22620]|uniref:cell division protein FtsQ/DivIB n=1 Tax=Chitinophaga sp. 22620 TaxID=3453952 RepID=UPI003F834647
MQPKTKTAFKRIGIVLLWSGVLVGFAVLLAAAVHDKESEKCKGIHVTLQGDDRNAFIDEKDIKQLVITDKSQNPVGMPISQINLANLERVVESDPWVRSAELYLDNQDILNVNVVQRDPVARVFTFSGNSFYLDEQSERIPVSDRFSARVPVFTGFPTDAVQLRKEDSPLYRQIGDMARYIAADTFWNAQVEQVMITGDRKFEIIPKLGDHVIVFGDGSDIDTKFSKLLIFYREGLSKAGWNTYSRINIAYHEEVIGTRRDGKSAPPPPMYRDSSIADVTMDADLAPPAAVTNPKPADKPAAVKPATKPAAKPAKPAKPASRPAARPASRNSGATPKAVYNRPNNNRNRN